MTSVASEASLDLTDEAILQRFRRSTSAPPGSKLLAFELISVSQEKMEVEVSFDARADLFATPIGNVQGGYLCAMLDEAMSVACLIASKMSCVAPTLEMKTSFLRPATPGALRAVGRVAKWGRQIAFTEGELFDSEGRLVAKATGTAMPTPFANYKKG